MRLEIPAPQYLAKLRGTSASRSFRDMTKSFLSCLDDKRSRVHWHGARISTIGFYWYANMQVAVCALLVHTVGTKCSVYGLVYWIIYFRLQHTHTHIYINITIYIYTYIYIYTCRNRVPACEFDKAGQNPLASHVNIGTECCFGKNAAIVCYPK